MLEEHAGRAVGDVTPCTSNTAAKPPRGLPTGSTWEDPFFAASSALKDGAGTHTQKKKAVSTEKAHWKTLKKHMELKTAPFVFAASRFLSRRPR